MKNIITILLVAILISACANKDKGSEKVYEPNIDKRARAAADKIIDKEGGIFGGRKGSTTYEFATSNVLWRATLKTLDFMPMGNASYSGGIIVTDWYSPDSSNESIKIYVQFTSNELSTSSLKIKSYVKKCDATLSKCSVTNGSEKLSNEILEKIIKEARALSVEQEKKKK